MKAYILLLLLFVGCSSSEEQKIETKFTQVGSSQKEFDFDWKLEKVQSEKNEVEIESK